MELCAAAQDGDVDLVLDLLDRLGHDVDSAEPNRHNTALHVAAQGGHQGVVQALLARGANPAVQNKYGYTPFHCAAERGHAHIIQTMLGIRNGLEVAEIASNSGNGPLHFASANGHEKVVAMLCEAGVNPWRVAKNGRTPLEYAANDNVSRLIRDAQKRVAPPALQQRKHSVSSEGQDTTSGDATSQPRPVSGAFKVPRYTGGVAPPNETKQFAGSTRPAPPLRRTSSAPADRLTPGTTASATTNMSRPPAASASIRKPSSSHMNSTPSAPLASSTGNPGPRRRGSGGGGGGGGGGSVDPVRRSSLRRTDSGGAVAPSGKRTTTFKNAELEAERQQFARWCREQKECLEGELHARRAAFNEELLRRDRSDQQRPSKPLRRGSSSYNLKATMDTDNVRHELEAVKAERDSLLRQLQAERRAHQQELQRVREEERRLLMQSGRSRRGSGGSKDEPPRELQVEWSRLEEEKRQVRRERQEMDEERRRLNARRSVSRDTMESLQRQLADGLRQL